VIAPKRQPRSEASRRRVLQRRSGADEEGLHGVRGLIERCVVMPERS
jgi:hypothetical protein